MPRNDTLAICKGLAIILMVVGHTEGPAFLNSLIYIFHMPVFFLAAGYFFQRRYLSEPWDFVSRRFRGLYVPMVKWSLLFLVLHNLFFRVGLLNEQYGNAAGGVTHPYSWHQACQRLVHIVCSMGGYDEFLLGAFWFFRALLVSSILFLVLRRLVEMLASRYERRLGLLHADAAGAGVIVVLALAFAAFRLGNGLRVQTIIQGGIRETWGVAFFALGVVFRSCEDWVRRRPWLVLPCLAVLLTGACLHWAGMNLKPRLQDVLTLPLTGTAGFVATYHLSAWIARSQSAVRRLLVHVGSMTVYVYVFHILAFKVVSALKILWYGLPWGQVGCHMVIHDHPHDFFWVLYSLAGVSLPLLWMALWRRLRERRAGQV